MLKGSGLIRNGGPFFIMKKLRLLTSGESHGKMLTAILSGIPSGFTPNYKLMEEFLLKRRGGIGRSDRQKKETDPFEITSGILNGKTTGAPITFIIENSKNSIKGGGYRSTSTPRPGHCDLAGMLKFHSTDWLIISERASARRTAMDTLVGSFAYSILKLFKISAVGKIISIGGEENDEYFEKIIKKTGESGETIGGKIKITFKNIPPGLGNNFDDSDRIDGQIGSQILTIPGVKGIEIGHAINQSKLRGSSAHDAIIIDKGGFLTRNSNLAGGLEGGMTNGMPLELFVYMKPIPTTQKGIRSVNIQTWKDEISPSPRSDISVLDSLIVIAIAKISLTILDNFLVKFGGDTMEELFFAYNNYMSYLREKKLWKI